MALDLEKLLDLTKDVAARAALLMRSDASRTIQKKGAVDLVTDVDIAINQILCQELGAAHEEIDVVAEEGVANHLRRPSARYAWIIDPIDGTTNFVHGLEHSAVSIALFDRKEQATLLGVVLNPFRGECFSAIIGHGAFLNDARITVSSTVSLADALVCTGFAYDRNTNPDNNLAEFKATLRVVRDLRRLGAASLDLAYVAAGRFDGYFERGLKFWDMAAGMLLVSEAGGVVSEYNGAPIHETSSHIIATNSTIHPALLNTIRDARHKAHLPEVPVI